MTAFERPQGSYAPRDRVRPTNPIEAFVAFVVQSGSASAALSILRTMGAAEVEGFEAYARVLLS